MKWQIHMLYVLLLGISTEAVEHSKSIFTAYKRIMDQTLRVMDESVDPCDNFVNYASGKYGKNDDLYLQFDLHLENEPQVPCVV